MDWRLGGVCSNEYEKSRTEEAAKYLEQTKLQTSNGFTEEFSVMEDLMGLAIGENSSDFEEKMAVIQFCVSTYHCSQVGPQGPNGDLFQFLGPHFCPKVPIFSI